MTLGVRYYSETGRESRARIINGMQKKKKGRKGRKKNTYQVDHGIALLIGLSVYCSP